MEKLLQIAQESGDKVAQNSEFGTEEFQKLVPRPETEEDLINLFPNLAGNQLLMSFLIMGLLSPAGGGDIIKQ